MILLLFLQFSVRFISLQFLLLFSLEFDFFAVVYRVTHFLNNPLDHSFLRLLINFLQQLHFQLALERLFGCNIVAVSNLLLLVSYEAWGQGLQDEW